MLDKLLLLSGNDIPFIKAGISIHPPTLKEIAYIGEQAFFSGCEFLSFSKQKMQNQDKNHLEKFNDFEVLMTVINSKNVDINKKSRNYIQLVLLLLFPDFKISFLPMSILLTKKNQQGKIESHVIDKDNFDDFKVILNQFTCLKYMGGSFNKYNPAGPQARALVQKFKERQQKLMKLKNHGEEASISVLYQYASILSVGLQMDINIILQYTVYQLFDQFYRFKLELQHDMYIQAKLAGAKNLDEVKNWMGEIHPEDMM